MERRLATILAADVGGSLRLIAAGRTMPANLNTYHKAINRPLVDHRGRLRGSAGDGLITELEWPIEVARCAVEIQQEIEVHNSDLPEDRYRWFRIGADLGDVVADGGNHLGTPHDRSGRNCGLGQAH